MSRPNERTIFKAKNLTSYNKNLTRNILRSEDMSGEVFYPIFYGILLYFGLFIGITVMNGDVAFNLKANYKRWDMLNWFGVWFFTILYWIAFLPFTIIALIYWIFTVGRK